MEIYLVRHGETVWNTQQRYQGATDVPLSERGVWQAQRLADWFEQIPLVAVYASDLSRAFQTAEIIARPHNLKVELLPEFREMSFGEWEGLTASEIESKYGLSFYCRWLENPEAVSIPGAESLRSLLKRTLAGIDRIAKRHRSGKVTVVTHGGNIMSLGCHLKGEPLSAFWKYYQKNSSVCLLRVSDGEMILETMNDMRHLEGIRVQEKTTAPEVE